MDSKKQILIDTRSMFKERSVRTDEEQTNESKLQKRILTVRENRTKSPMRVGMVVGQGEHLEWCCKIVLDNVRHDEIALIQ